RLRARVSVGPPAAKGTIMVTARDGYCDCAHTGWVPAASPVRTSAENKRLIFIWHAPHHVIGRLRFTYYRSVVSGRHICSWAATSCSTLLETSCISMIL